MKILYAILIFMTALIVWAFGEPPTPQLVAVVSPDGVTNFVDFGTATYSVEGALEDGAPPEPTNIVLSASFERELTFEWVPELGSSNVVAYPITIQVPFEHDQGFVSIRARKVEQ